MGLGIQKIYEAILRPVVHWPGTWFTDLTINEYSLDFGQGISGDFIHMDNKYACLISISVLAPAGTWLDRVYYMPRVDCGGNLATAGPPDHNDPPPSPAYADLNGYTPIGRPGDRADGETVFRRQFRVYGSDCSAFTNFVIHQGLITNVLQIPPLPVIVTVTYTVASRPTA